MTMRAEFQLTVPDDVEATLTVTMPIGNWRRLLRQIEGESRYPARKLAEAVRELVQGADEHFVESHEIAL